MMYFRYKIKKDSFIFGGYTLTIQKKSDMDEKWRRFKRIDLFKACAYLKNEWFIMSLPDPDEQRATIMECIDHYGTIENLVIRYIVNILKDKSDNMKKQNTDNDLKQFLNNIADNAWSNIITINEDEITKEQQDV